MTDEKIYKGLSAKEVQASRRENGSNQLSKQKRRGFLHQLLSAFGDPIIKILCAALGINILFALRGQGWFEAAGIAIAIFMASFVSTLSEYGSESAFIKLQEEQNKTSSRAMRSGAVVLLPIGELVVGDTVLLQAGEYVPADGVLIQGEIEVDQSPVNGESKECKKRPGGNRDDRGTMAQSTLFRGTVVTSGEGVMEVCAVGDSTVFGQMAASLKEVPRESPLKARLNTLAKTLSKLGYFAAVLVALADLLKAVVFDNAMNTALITAEVSNLPLMMGNLIHALTLAISIVIMAVPEGLPMMITVVLSKNMFKMLRDKVMVRKLAGIETAGSMNLLFTDKTGTLTRGKPSVSGFVWMGGEGDTASLPEEIARVVHLSGYINTSSKLSKNRAVGGNSTDRMMLELSLGMKINIPLPQRRALLPFDSKYKYSAAETQSGVLVKGAPDKLLSKCTRYMSENGPRPLSSPRALIQKAEEWGKKGMRVLCICTASEMPTFDTLPPLCFVCLALISDPLRAETSQSVKELREAGVQVVMVTGDSRDTAASVAKDCGILCAPDQTILTGEQMQRLSDKRLCSLLPRLAVVARALPGDKSRLVRVAQSAGYVCGMTGDGINDAPALRLADVGFSMGSGTEVAKEAGDIVITDDNIASICRSVLYGRTILRSIRRFIVFQLTVNFCAVGISLLGPFIGVETPITVAQILWINMIMDTLGGLAFAGEPALREYMKTPPDKRTSPILNGEMKEQIACITAVTVGIYLFFLRAPMVRYLFPTESALLTGFFALFIFCGIISAFCSRTLRANILHSLVQNRSFVLIMSAVICVQLVLIYFGGQMFRTSGLSLPQLLFVVVLSLMIIPIDCIRKLLQRSRRRGKM